MQGAMAQRHLASQTPACYRGSPNPHSVAGREHPPPRKPSGDDLSWEGVGGSFLTTEASSPTRMEAVGEGRPTCGERVHQSSTRTVFFSLYLNTPHPPRQSCK